MLQLTGVTISTSVCAAAAMQSYATMTVATCSGMQAYRQRQLIAILAEYNEAACSDAPPVHVAMLLTGRRERAAHGDR